MGRKEGIGGISLKDVASVIKHRPEVRDLRMSEKVVLAEEIGYLMSGMLEQNGSQQFSNGGGETIVSPSLPYGVVLPGPSINLVGIRQAEARQHFAVVGLHLRSDVPAELSVNFNHFSMTYDEKGVPAIDPKQLPSAKNLRKIRRILEFMKTEYSKSPKTS